MTTMLMALVILVAPVATKTATANGDPEQVNQSGQQGTDMATMVFW
jgi:hypothetical protein